MPLVKVTDHRRNVLFTSFEIAKSYAIGQDSHALTEEIAFITEMEPNDIFFVIETIIISKFTKILHAMTHQRIGWIVQNITTDGIRKWYEAIT